MSDKDHVFTNPDADVFGFRNLPEAVKGALFARYSRSPRPLRDLYEAEFAGADGRTGDERADALYRRVLDEYGDDSVAQLGSAHVAVEGASNVLTKILERGRLMSYLEQSTRYIPYTERVEGRWRYLTPPEITDSDERTRYEAAMDRCFEVYAGLIPRVEGVLRRRMPQEDTPDGAYRRTVRAKALDAVRGLLPAATRSNLGIHGSGQAFEALVMRLQAHPLAEARTTGDRMLSELESMVPAFVRRTRLPERGGAWIEYLAERRDREAAVAAMLADDTEQAQGGDNRVDLIDWDPGGEARVLAAAMMPHCDVGTETLRQRAAVLRADDRRRLLLEVTGNRGNRRHRPGRAFEQTAYTFEVVADYGAFRDLQRHRMLSMDWQELTPAHGATRPMLIDECGGQDEWGEAIGGAAEAHARLKLRWGSTIAQYAVPMAFRIRFTMTMNAREVMHVIELRTQPAGHPSYRRICQQMHTLIRTKAGHGAIADAMAFADHGSGAAGRLKAEERSEARRTAS